MPFCLPLAERAELLFGDQEGHHVFPVVGFSFQPLTVHLSLGITHPATHIVFGLNRGIVANLRLPGRSALTLAPPLSTTNIRARIRRAPQRAAPTHFHADVRPPMSRVWAERADRRREPGDGRHRLKSSCRLQFPTPRSFPNRIFRWLHHIHAIHCHHIVSTHLRNRPSCLVHLKIATDTPRLLGFAI